MFETGMRTQWIIGALAAATGCIPIDQLPPLPETGMPTEVLVFEIGDEVWAAMRRQGEPFPLFGRPLGDIDAAYFGGYACDAAVGAPVVDSGGWSRVALDAFGPTGELFELEGRDWLRLDSAFTGLEAAPLPFVPRADLEPRIVESSALAVLFGSRFIVAVGSRVVDAEAGTLIQLDSEVVGLASVSGALVALVQDGRVLRIGDASDFVAVGSVPAGPEPIECAAMADDTVALQRADATVEVYSGYGSARLAQFRPNNSSAVDSIQVVSGDDGRHVIGRLMRYPVLVSETGFEMMIAEPSVQNEWLSADVETIFGFDGESYAVAGRQRFRLDDVTARPDDVSGCVAQGRTILQAGEGFIGLAEGALFVPRAGSRCDEVRLLGQPLLAHWAGNDLRVLIKQCASDECELVVDYLSSDPCAPPR